MSERLFLVEEASPAVDARALAERLQVHHLMVVYDGELVGVTCLCDLLQAGDLDSVSRRMRSPAVCVAETASVEQAAATMQQCGVGCLPVVSEDGVLLGVVTRRDLRRNGTLPGEKGIDRCGRCGTTHHLRPADGLLNSVLCFACAMEVARCP